MQEAALCAFDGATYLFFSEGVPSFVYYSHIPVFIAALVMALYVVLRKDRGLQNWVLFWAIVPFLAWVVLDSIFWASNKSDTIMFVWSAIILIEPLIHAVIFYLQYTLIYNRPMPFWLLLVLSLPFYPLILLTPTTLTLSAFDLNSCLAVEGFIGLYYSYTVELLFIALITASGIWAYLKSENDRQKAKIFYLTAGILFFLVAFTGGNIIGSFTSNWQIGQLGLLGMPVFLGSFVYIIVKFQVLNRKVLGAQALVIVLWLLLLGTLFMQTIESARLIIGGTLILFAILGFSLIRTVRQGERQRLEIEKLANELKDANQRLKELDKLKSEFVSIASHQLRSPLTSIRGYASMLLEGSYGKIPKKATEAISRIESSSRYMALTVEDFLNVSRIESGTMKYEMSDFDICELAETLVEDVRTTVEEKELTLTFASKIQSCTVHADVGKIRQILQNLIDNATKYTPEGTVAVSVEQPDDEHVAVHVKDTGIGMSKHTLDSVFQKFVRAKNANSVNVIGSGLGLYVAREMARHMGGTITADSEGEGKGATFTLTIPVSGNSSQAKSS